MYGAGVNLTATPLAKIESKQPPIIFDPKDFGGEQAAGQIFTVGVRLKTEQVRILRGSRTIRLIKIKFLGSPFRNIGL